MIQTRGCPGGVRHVFHRNDGFTLVEIMIGTALSVMILAGALGAFLFVGRTEARIQNYNEMETTARNALETFADDARPASAITWNRRDSITLSVNSLPVTYAYDSTNHTFSRQDGAGIRTLVRGIKDGSFVIQGYTVAGTAITALSTEADLAAAGDSTKQLDVSFALLRANRAAATATDTVLSARIILRNKVAAQ